MIVEPWLRPQAYRPGSAHAVFVDEPDLKAARLSVSAQDGMISKMVMHYLVATPEGVSYFTEPLELALYTDADYAAAFEGAGLRWEQLEGGPTGRGLFVGLRAA